MYGADALQAQPTHHTSVFSEAVMIVPVSNNFKMLNIPLYSGRGDLTAHVDVFHMWMDLKRVSELARCWVFPLPLTRLAQS